ncbi:serine/threonine-protein kinase [Streptomyces bungoensis]|uniref:serine/threonine-protein kinase n=1 Tax=Streptomyces bungoensis TaxID=285568 RepID=UPI0033D6FA7C
MGARIGSGGMADVYDGVDTRLRRPVAVKVFRPGPDAHCEDRLAAEAVLLARLQHPGLVTVYDVGRYEDRTYLVMQLVDGPTLRSLLAGGTLPERRVAELGAALAGALAHVHRAGIVHRDVKPSNVLVDPAGAPHLADFGIARVANTTVHTAPDVLIGTAAYLAPEQVEGGRVGPAADVYALGLVLLECLKGELEYQGTAVEVAVARLHRPPAVPAWLSPDLAALLGAMTARDPEARPDAGQCARELARLCSADGAHALQQLPAPAEARVPRARAARHEADDPVRTQEAPAARTGVPGNARPSRRLAVGTALAALSVALGTTLAVAPRTSGAGDDRAAAPSSPAATGSRPGTVSPVRPLRAQPSSGTVDVSDPAAGSSGSHAEPAVQRVNSPGTPDSTYRAPAGRHGAEHRKPSPHRPAGTDGRPRHAAPHGGPQHGASQKGKGHG